MKKTNVPIGQKFGRLTIIKEVEPIKHKKYYERRVLCKCDCGIIKNVSFYQLKEGRIFSCGCYRKEVTSMTGKDTLKYNKDATSSKLYTIWRGIKCRCNTPSSGAYKRYGGKGIKICKEWVEDFSSFYDWAINNGYSEGLTIDRIDYDGDYEPSNCRWVDYLIQANNRRTNVVLSYNGEIHTIADWSRILGIPKTVLYNRKHKGWSDEKIISTPVKYKKS